MGCQLLLIYHQKDLRVLPAFLFTMAEVLIRVELNGTQFQCAVVLLYVNT